MNKPDPTNTESLPWYRYAMVWMIILLPLSVVVASIYTMVLAHQNAPTIVPSQSQPSEVVRPEKQR